MFIKSIVGLAMVALVAANDTNSTIDPNTVDPSLRSQWCTGEINTCGTLCDGDYDANTCDTTTLKYTCTCSSNSSSPGLQYYLQSMPTFICEKIYQDCISKGENDAAAQKLCTQARAKNCGKLDPDKYVAAAPSSSASSPASASATATATSPATTATASSTPSSAAAPALKIGREYGAGILAAGVAGLFGLIL
ncbi:hypothetical protein DSL72_004394 [Monilinia vaccinii-corymbosi]|uniref:DUF7707 domain-containing protein n=1 Tax=Monilinia vaccinii-corymbosi TaxID=61207 RepID=A0A8A3P3Q6_9HELO|nr:hypothetical protein DSL72_004394 [Monilinia vaccinii-corymbosi]